jgi:hypothetical protein
MQAQKVNMSTKVTKGLTRLHSLEAKEVSLVPEGANRRRFLIFKSAKGESQMPQPHEEMHQLISKTDPVVMQKVDHMLKSHGASVHKDPAHAPVEPPDKGQPADPEGSDGGEATPGGEHAGGPLPEQAHAAVKAIVRIASPFKGKIPPLLMHQVLDAAGFELTSGEDGEGHEVEGDPGAMHIGDGHKEAAFMAIPEKIEGEENDVLKFKVGKAKPFGGGDEDNEGSDEDDGDDEEHEVKKSHMHEAAEKANATYKEHMAKLGYRKYPDAEMAMKVNKGKHVIKEKGEHVSKAATGTAQNLPTVDAATRRQFELVAKSNKELVEKNAKLEERIAAGERREREKEIVAKAATYTHVALAQDEVVAMLKDADKNGKESFERVCKNFDTLNEQGKSSKLFGEFGSNLSHPGNGSSVSESAWAKIEKAAEGYVAKAGLNVTPQAAVEKFLQTTEGQKMYAEYKSGRKDGI